jgi:hypothetical protein
MIDQGWETAAGAIAQRIDDHLGVKSEAVARLVDVA